MQSLWLLTRVYARIISLKRALARSIHIHRNDTRSDDFIGASLSESHTSESHTSESHTSESNGGFFIYLQYVFRKCNWNFFNPKHCAADPCGRNIENNYVKASATPNDRVKLAQISAGARRSAMAQKETEQDRLQRQWTKVAKG